MDDFLAVGEDAARAGGKVLLEWKGKIRVREKGPRDLVTQADIASQEAIRKVVLGAFPDHDFLGEEETEGQSSAAYRKIQGQSGFRWIVDPLDGTTNYVHELRSFAVSIALEKEGKIIAGVVLDPELDECYTATAGGGAFLNGQAIHPSRCTQLDQALVVSSLPAHVSKGAVEVRQMVEVIHACQSLRRLGSAALNLCYVAQGRLDAYWATSVKIWDIAAGMLILEEAGGAMTSLEGGAIDFQRPRFVAAATPTLQRELLEVLRRAAE